VEGFFSTIRFFFGCGTLLLVALVVLAHFPKSPLRSALVQVCGWGTAALCGAYALSPIDALPEILLGPFGVVDDLLAVIIGFMSARAAWRAGEEKAFLQAEEKRKAG
jgi:uncharacterized membrane protein YkvA (DUF1232 family)